MSEDLVNISSRNGLTKGFQTYLNCDTVPRGIRVPANVNCDRYLVEPLRSYQLEYPPDYVNGDEKHQQHIRTVIDMVHRCSYMLRCSQHVLNMACYFLHSFQNTAEADNILVSIQVCTALFMSMKYYKSTEFIKIEDVIRILFGEQSSVTPDEIIDVERIMLRAVDYRLETNYPYQLVELYAHVARLNYEQFNLFSYIIAMILEEPKALGISPAQLAAAALLLVMEKHNLCWDKSVSYWTAETPRSLYQVRAMLVKMWNFHWQQYQEGVPLFVTRVFLKSTNYGAANIAPPSE